MPVNLFLQGKSGLVVLVALAMLGYAVQTNAQTPAPVTASTATAAKAPNVPWSMLSATQKQALAPLSEAWATLNEGQRRKWIAIAQNYGSLATAEQEKLHSRMVEWTALTPKDRELARLNFAQTKSVTKPERAANWEAYQALSPDEKKKLAANAATPPAGAALAAKPANRDKLTQVPVTRRTPEAQKATAMPQIPVNRNTLLPQNTQPATKP